ncbi:Paired box pox-neuro protein, partial [Eumeta japonica]
AANQFLPYTAHSQTSSNSYFTSSLHGSSTVGGYTKSESSIDLTVPSAGETLSDCDSEELLKKPEKRMRHSSPRDRNVLKLNNSNNFSPKKDDCNVSVCSASSNSNHSSVSSHISCVGDDSSDDERHCSSTLNVATTETEDNCEPVEVVN